MDKRKYSQRTRHAEGDGDPSLSHALKSCLCGLLISLSAALFLLAIMTVYSLNRPDPEGTLLPIASFLCYPCAMLGGFISCKIYRGSPSLCGIVFGLMMLLLSVLIYPMLPATDGHGMSALSFFALRGLLVLCCATGSVLGAKAFSGNGKRRRRRRR